MASTGDKIKGKAMRAEGKLTGDRIREAQGVMKEKKGAIKGAVERAGRKVKRVARKIRRKASKASR
jgi:uncharacterized protein YjbJ (UPF0337 family)